MQVHLLKEAINAQNCNVKMPESNALMSQLLVNVAMATMIS